MTKHDYPETCMVCEHLTQKKQPLLAGRLKRLIGAEKGVMNGGKSKKEYRCWTEVRLCPVCKSVHWGEELFRDEDTKDARIEELEDLTGIYEEL